MDKVGQEEPALSSTGRATLSLLKKGSIWLLTTVIITTICTKYFFGEAPLGPKTSLLTRAGLYASKFLFTGWGAAFSGILLGIILAMSFTQSLIKHDILQQKRRQRGIRDPEIMEQFDNVTATFAIPKMSATNWSYDGSGDPKSEMSEAANAIAAAIIARSGGIPMKVLFSSSLPAEGKSSIALAVARCLARMRNTTLLVDADLRAPSQSRMHRHPDSPGLSNIVIGKDSRECIRLDPAMTGLTYIASGDIPLSAPPILYEANKSDVWNRLLVGRDYLVIDGPPALGLADVAILAASVDLIIFVIEVDRIKLRDLHRTIKRVIPVGKPVIAVLNKAPNTWSYGYEYSYGPSEPVEVVFGPPILECPEPAKALVVSKQVPPVMTRLASWWPLGRNRP